jgi:hypothetical protein
MKTCIELASITLAFLLTTSVAFSQTSGSASASGSFSLQGQLTNTSGTAIADGQHSIAVSVYQQGSTTPIYTETDVTTTANGVFDIMVGSGNASQKLTLNSGGNYSLGIAVDGQAQLQPLLSLGSSPSSITANVADTSALALNAQAVGGFTASANGGANTIPVLNAQGQLSASILDSSTVVSINGSHGNVTIQGGGNLNVTSNGNAIQLSFNGGNGNLNFPFSQTLDLSSGSGFSITNTLQGSAGSFINTGTGTALAASATSGTALNATSTGSAAIMATTSASGSAALQLKNTASSGSAQLMTAINGSGSTVADLTTNGLALSGAASGSGSGSAVLSLQNSASNSTGSLIWAANANDSAVFSLATNGAAMLKSSASGAALSVSSTAGGAISATGSSTNGAILQVQNTASGSGSAAGLISASNSGGSAVFSVGANGATMVNATADTALTLATSASGGVALKATASAAGATAARLTGGLSLVGPVGTGTVTAGNMTASISNAYANANSVIILTVNSTISGLTSGIRITGQSAGSFTVGLLSALALTSDLSFNYLIINQ